LPFRHIFPIRVFTDDVAYKIIKTLLLLNSAFFACNGQFELASAFPFRFLFYVSW